MANFKIEFKNGCASLTNFVVIPVLVCASALYYYSIYSSSHPHSVYMASSITEKFGVKIERDPPQSKLARLGVESWPKWGCSPSKFPWTFTTTETMFLLEGKVKVYCDGHDEFFEIGAGDLVKFPKGMKVIWDVTEAVNKHYKTYKTTIGQGNIQYTQATSPPPLLFSTREHEGGSYTSAFGALDDHGLTTVTVHHQQGRSYTSALGALDDHEPALCTNI